MNREPVRFSFGHLPDPPDSRDFKLKISPQTVLVPTDLRSQMRPIKNQGNLGACTAFATTAMVEFVRSKQRMIEWDASPLFTYYSSRKIEGTIPIDSGAYVRDALKSTVKDGVVKEESWPYIVENFAMLPPSAVWVEAETHQTLTYSKVDQTQEGVLGCLSEGYPFTFGAKLFDSFIKTQTGMFVTNTVPMPNLSADKYVGGHCMLAVGYTSASDTSIEIIVRNSWSEYVGIDGYHFMPIEYILDPTLSMDFWTIRTEEYAQEDILQDPVIPPAPTPEPVIPPEPAPVPTPEPVIPPVPVKKSMWKDPITYVVILFVLLLLSFVLL